MKQIAMLASAFVLVMLAMSGCSANTNSDKEKIVMSDNITELQKIDTLVGRAVKPKPA